MAAADIVKDIKKTFSLPLRKKKPATYTPIIYPIAGDNCMQKILISAKMTERISSVIQKIALLLFLFNITEINLLSKQKAPLK